MDGVVRDFDLLVERVRAVDRPVRLVGVDGCGGAGKTTFAARLSRAAGGVPVVHTDDFASHADPLGWWPRFDEQVVQPLLAGRPAVFRPYDWPTGRFTDDEITVAPAGFVIIEGVSATRRAWRDDLAVRVWVDSPRELRLRRGIERDGEASREFWQTWVLEEDAYVAAESPQRHADVVVDGAPSIEHDPEIRYDPETQYVELSAPR